MQVRNKIGVKSLNVIPTSTPKISFYPIPTPTPPESESGFGVQCRALLMNMKEKRRKVSMKHEHVYKEQQAAFIISSLIRPT
jgi:hypothetical protein